MTTKSSERLSPIEIAFIIIAFAIVVASLSYVILMNYDRSPSSIEVSLDGYDGGYDVSVINQADIDDFMVVSGIGQVKASEIVAYRDALGGFEDVYQLLDVKSINAQLFESIMLHFYFSDTQSSSDSLSDSVSGVSSDVDVIADEAIELPADDITYSGETDTAERKSVNINSASAEEIEACLLISSDQADQIVEIRELIGGYSNRSELALCSLISNELYGEIKDYIELQ